MNKATWVIAIGAVLVLGNCLYGQTTYQYDDGVSENNLGHGGAGDFFWGNYFFEVSSGPNIVSLSIAFGDVGVPAGSPFQVAIYDDLDNDGDPTTNLMFLGSTSGTVDMPSPVGTDTFQKIAIPNTPICNGFFVAALIDGTNSPLPANIDQSSSLGQSWFAEHNVIGGLDIADPFGSATLAGLVDDFGFPGNFLIRAEAEGCLLGDVNQDGHVDLLDVAPFIELITTNTYQCEGDINL